MARSDSSFRNKTILITGGSTGIGAAFAERFAALGARLVLVARTASTLEALASSLRARHGVAVDVVVEDLGGVGAAQRVLERLQALGLKVDVLVNNAGFGLHAPFDRGASSTYTDMVQLNVTGLMELTHALLPMLQAQRGGVINVVSTAAYQPLPYMAVYAATKAFVLSFSEALWIEQRGRVRVLAVCPGSTDTSFFARSGESASVGTRVAPSTVVDTALAGYAADKASVVVGGGNWLTAQLARFMPRSWVVRITGRLMRPTSTTALSAAR